jgi:hypothetical protein
VPKFLADRFGGLSARKRGLHREATPRVAPVGHDVDGAAQQALGDGARRRRVECHTNIGRRPLGIAVERLAKQSLLAAEGGIEAGTLDSHRLGEIRQHRTLVALAPEDQERLMRNQIDVKLARTPCRHGDVPPFLYLPIQYSPLTGRDEAAIMYRQVHKWLQRRPIH